jgi:putative membrane protein
LSEESAAGYNSARTRDHLANERTFLAWIRTGLGMIGLGFVAARLGLFLHEMAVPVPASGNEKGSEFVLAGLVILCCGVALTVWGGYAYRRGRVAINREKFEPANWPIVLVTTIVALGGAGLALLILWRLLAVDVS